MFRPASTIGASFKWVRQSPVLAYEFRDFTSTDDRPSSSCICRNPSWQRVKRRQWRLPGVAMGCINYPGNRHSPNR
jgi:hypothetical protein